MVKGCGATIYPRQHMWWRSTEICEWRKHLCGSEWVCGTGLKDYKGNQVYDAVLCQKCATLVGVLW